MSAFFIWRTSNSSALPLLAKGFNRLIFMGFFLNFGHKKTPLRRNLDARGLKTG
ncbi:hypothetical protein MICA_1515 [Micavibrio aeruginosavorus ARL-13]|uniref:Uncharacterized protein n=1 Tax=Micavibrio aeruginosavorus (strain ARL-13) TaxID=856793 RepID=G2KNI5_MICAA|nr:hypothetical protein MICA_1515 [Micavibrio aeruginosavorus ARL-13]